MTLRERLASIIAPLPPGASVTLPADALRAWLEEEPEEDVRTTPPGIAIGDTWREKLWVVPAETRLGIQEVAEALNRSRSWVYKRTMRSAGKSRIPHRKLDGGELVFVAGEVRAWIREHEEAVLEGPMESTEIEHSMLRGIRNTWRDA